MSDKDLLNKIWEVIQRMDVRQDAQAETLTRLTNTVEVHEKRSTQLETRVVPIEQHVTFVRNVWVALIWAAGALAAFAGLLKTLGVF